MLIKIQDTVVKYARILTQILQVDIGIADENLRYVAITGHKAQMLNQDISNQAYIFRRVLETGQPQVIEMPKHHSICQECPFRSTCNETFEMSMPIKLNQRVIGVVGLMCFTDEQKQHILDNYDPFYYFLEQITELIALKAMEAEEYAKSLVMINLLESVFERIETGVIVLNEKGGISRINQIGKKILRFSQKEISKSRVQLEETGEKMLDMLEYLLSIGNNQYRLFGKQYDIHVDQYSKILLFNDADISSAPSLSIISKKKNLGIQRLLGSSPKIEELRRKILIIASSSSSVLFTGEDGTEKKTFAMALYEESDRHDEPFVAFNCASVPQDKLDEELFGSVQTSDDKREAGKAIGKIESAGKGTIFLDEITRLPLSLQYKLLNVLDSKKITRIGASKQISVRARFLFACNREIQQMVRDGDFRKDLYYRMNIIPIDIPSLRERKTDIQVIAKSFIRQSAKTLGKTITMISDEFWAAVENYSWPGNIFELRNTMEFVVNMLPYSGVLDAYLLPNQISGQDQRPQSDDLNLKRLEKAAIIKAIDKYGNNKQQIAEELGIGIATLYRKLNQYDL